MNLYCLKVTGLKAGRYEICLGGKKVAEHSAEELSKGVNLAAAALTAGPIADQVQAVWKAVQAKNDYFHNRIFRGVVLANIEIPDFLELKLSPAQIQARREAAWEERMAKMPELDEAIQKALVIKPYEVKIALIGQ